MKNIRAFSTSMERMTTGLKINSAKDDPAGFYISSKFATQISGLDAANTNIQNAISILEQADKSLEEVSGLLDKMRDLIESSCSEYLTPKERDEKQKQINSLFAQAMKVKNEAEVDGFKVFNDKQTLDKTQTYTDGKVAIAAGQVLNQVTPAQQQAQAAAAAANAANEPAAVGDMGVYDGAVPAYSGEDDGAAAIPAAYSPEEDYSVEAEEYAEDDDEMALAFDDGGVADANAGIALVDDMGVAPAAYGGEDTSNPTSGSVDLTGTSESNKALIEITLSTGDVYKYDACYRSGSDSNKTINWSIDENDQITFQTDSTNGIDITAHSGQTDNVSLDGAGGGIDFINFNAGDLNDTIVVKVGKIAGNIEAGDGNDSIVNNGYVYGNIGGEAGDDSIVNESFVVGSLEAGEGADTIINAVNASVGYEICGDLGNDSIVNDGTVHTIYGGEGADTIINSENATVDNSIYGEAGDDSIVNEGTVYKIYGGEGTDTIINSENATVEFEFSGDAGNDSIVNEGTVWQAYGGEGDDTITNNGVVVEHVAGGIIDSDDSANDTFIYGANSSVGGYVIENVFDAVDNDKILGIESLLDENGKQIVRKSGSVDLTGTADNSHTTISITKSNGEVYQYDVWLHIDCGDSNKTLNWSIDENDQITFQTDSTNDIVITAHSGQEDNVSLNGEGIRFSAGDMNDNVIVKEGNNASCIVMGDGDDKLISYSTAVTTIGLEAGDDIFYNYGNMLIQDVERGSGNDTVYNYGTADKIDIGAGDDVVYNYGSVGYIDTGDGNDTFENNGSVGGCFVTSRFQSGMLSTGEAY